MPCRDFYDDRPDLYFKEVTEPALKKQISFAESALCQTLAAFEKFLQETNLEFGGTVNTDPLNYVDYKEAGITRAALQQWWASHKELDAKMREEERRKQLRATLLTKLNDEERNALAALSVTELKKALGLR